MDYEMLLKSVMQYETLYNRGLKFEANSMLKNLCYSIESLSTDDRETVLKQLVNDICETETMTFLFERGNGQIPFQLKSVIYNWLYPRCRQNMTPELRWFYQIFKNDPDHCELANNFLDEAYAHTTGDMRIQQLVFERNLNSLDYGLHELPSGILISDEEAQIIFQQCDAIIQNCNIPKILIDRYFKLKHDYLMYKASEN